MNESELMQADDQISLLDLWEKLRNGWRSVVGGVALGALSAGLAIVLISPKYETTSVLQVGMTAGKEVEAVTTTVERFKSLTFVLEATKQAGVVAGDCVTGQLVKGTSLIELKTIGDTPESSSRLNDIVVRMLVERHDALGAPLKRKLESDIAVAKGKLKAVERELAHFPRVTPLKDGQFSSVSLLVSLKVQKQQELFALQQELISLELMMVPPATQTTHTIEAPFVALKPVSPKKGLLIALGLIGGLLLGVMAAFVRDAWVQTRLTRGRAS